MNFVTVTTVRVIKRIKQGNQAESIRNACTECSAVQFLNLDLEGRTDTETYGFRNVLLEKTGRGSFDSVSSSEKRQNQK